MRLVCAVLVALMGLGTVGAGSAWAQSEGGNSVLYPFVLKDDPRSVTLITYMGPNFVDAGGPFVPTINGLHYQYHAKGAVSPATSTSACLGSSFRGNTSRNDVLTYDATGFFGTQPFFDDTTSEGALGLNLGAVSPSIAYLLINNLSEGLPGPNFGEAQIFDLANGGLWGYNAVAIPDRSDGRTIGGGVALLTGTRRPVALYPEGVASTNFVVTPMGADMQFSSANRATLQMQLSEASGSGSGFAGVYDRNENPIDFQASVTTECVWVFPLRAVIGLTPFDRPSFRTGGGWGWLANIGGTNQQNAIVFKVISAGSAGSFVIDGQPVFTSLCGSGGTDPATGVQLGQTTTDIGCSVPLQ